MASGFLALICNMASDKYSSGRKTGRKQLFCSTSSEWEPRIKIDPVTHKSEDFKLQVRFVTLVWL